GCSPWRERRRYSSARASTGWTAAEDPASCWGPSAACFAVFMATSRAGESLRGRGIEKTGDALEELLQPCQGAKIAVAGCGLRQAEDRRGLAVAQLLEVPQGDDFAVERRQLVQRRLDLELHLGPRQGWAG